MYVRRRALGDLSTVAQTIQQIEGYSPGTLAYRNNNPGNLRPAGQPGCTPVNGFCSFPDYATGYQALENQITLDAGRGLSIQEFISKYAPASDNNNPTSYAASLASAAGLSVNDPLSAALSDSSFASMLPDVSSFDPLTLGALIVGGLVLWYAVG